MIAGLVWVIVHAKVLVTNNIHTQLPYSAKFWRGKILANRSFQTFGEENVSELLIILLATLANLEFGWVKYWRMMYSSPNSPKFSPARVLRYTVYVLTEFSNNRDPRTGDCTSF